MLPCKLEERGWNGFVLDVITMGGYTLYRTLEYGKCVQNLREEDLVKVVKAFSPRLLRDPFQSTETKSRRNNLHNLHKESSQAIASSTE
jgi:hypothetical protein